MKIILSGIVVILTMIIVNSCRSTKSNIRQDDKIVFGYYGGFAGSYDEFTLYGSGTIEHRKSLKASPNLIKGVEKKTAKQLLRSVEDLKIYDMEIHDPGNMTYFLKFIHLEKEHELKWGGGEEVPASLKDYFSLLRKLTKDRNPVM